MTLLPRFRLSTPSTPTLADLEQLTHHVPCTEAERVALLDTVRGFSPEHTMRAMILQTTDAQMAHAGSHALRAWTTFKQHLPEHTPFSFLPISVCFIAVAFAAATRYPDTPLAMAQQQFAQSGAEEFTKNPLFSILWKSVDHDLIAYLELHASSGSSNANFGHSDFERISDSHVALHTTSGYSAFARVLEVPFFKGLFAHLDLDATVRLEIHDEHSYIIDLDWT